MSSSIMSAGLECLGNSAPGFIHLVLAGDLGNRRDQEAFLHLTGEGPGALALAPRRSLAPRPTAITVPSTP